MESLRVVHELLKLEIRDSVADFLFGLGEEVPGYVSGGDHQHLLAMFPNISRS